MPSELVFPFKLSLPPNVENFNWLHAKKDDVFHKSITDFMRRIDDKGLVKNR